MYSIEEVDTSWETASSKQSSKQSDTPRDCNECNFLFRLRMVEEVGTLLRTTIGTKAS